MAGSNNGRVGANKKKAADYKNICPDNRRKDLDALVKSLNGDEEKIIQRIQEWWDEPVKPEEPDWENVNSKNAKKKAEAANVNAESGRGGRSTGRGRNARGGAGGRGAGRDGGRRGTGGRDGRGGAGRGRGDGRGKSNKKDESTGAPTPEVASENEKDLSLLAGGPTTSEPAALQGAWGQTATTSIPVQTNPIIPIERQEKSMELNIPVVTSTPSPAPARSSGNVWATKGSAHLIKAENSPSVLIAAPPAPPVVASRTQRSARAPPPIPEPAPASTSTLESGLPASVNGANINAAGWKPAAETSQLDSLSSTMTQPIEHEKVPSKPEPSIVSQEAPRTNVLSMGRWETADTDESQNLDFTFGSFGNDNEAQSVGDSNLTNNTPVMDNSDDTVDTGPTSASPARPPPGLSIGSVPQVPANAVLVSDLESKLEGTSLGHVPTESVRSHMDTHSMQAFPSGVPYPGVTAAHLLPPAGGMAQNYTSAYGMAGMYNYNAANNGFIHGAPVLPGGMPPKAQGGLSGPASSAPQMGGLHGAPTPAATGNDVSTIAGDASMPSGIPNMAAYNPALFYGQQQYQMGPSHGVGGYGYGYGAQFGGAVQGGFGYQQGMMGTSAGYPPYDDQQQPGAAAGYQKNNSGGYRGRGGSQYQNQYQPQGGYSGQPYAMGYNDHFNQRGGYGPGSIDHYGMQQGGSSFVPNQSFQTDDDHHKGGKKGGRSSGSLQPHGHPLSGQQQQPPQQSFGLQGDSNANAGWSNQAGAWGGPSWQGS